MFDKGTKEWLEKREIIKTRNGFYFCGHCQNYSPSHYDQYTGYCACDYIECPLVTDYRDASEFEALVAAIMPYIVFRIVAEQAEQKDIAINSWECLKLARLTVEAEMEA